MNDNLDALMEGYEKRIKELKDKHLDEIAGLKSELESLQEAKLEVESNL